MGELRLKKYYARVKRKEDGYKMVIEHESSNKESFAASLRGNGYSVIKIYSEKQWNEI